MVSYGLIECAVHVRGQVNSSGKPQTHWLPTPRGLTTVTSVCGPRLAPRAWTGPSSRSTTRRPAAKLSFSTREKETATASSRAGFHGVHGCRDGATRNVHEEAQMRRPTQTTESGQEAPSISLSTKASCDSSICSSINVSTDVQSVHRSSHQSAQHSTHTKSQQSIRQSVHR